jgi:hypothetical protein
VREGKVPVALENQRALPSEKRVGGTGFLRHVEVIQVLTLTRDGRGYLVPAYRFEGTAHIQGDTESQVWFALVPAAQPAR